MEFPYTHHPLSSTVSFIFQGFTIDALRKLPYFSILVKHYSNKPQFLLPSILFVNFPSIWWWKLYWPHTKRSPILKLHSFFQFLQILIGNELRTIEFDSFWSGVDQEGSQLSQRSVKFCLVSEKTQEQKKTHNDFLS